MTCWYCAGGGCEDCGWTGRWPLSVSEADIHPAERDEPEGDVLVACDTCPMWHPIEGRCPSGAGDG